MEKFSPQSDELIADQYQSRILVASSSFFHLHLLHRRQLQSMNRAQLHNRLPFVLDAAALYGHWFQSI